MSWWQQRVMSRGRARRGIPWGRRGLAVLVVGAGVVGFVGLGGDAAAARGWTLEHEESGVRVWSRAVAGSELLEVRGQKVIGAPPAEVWAVIDDYRNYTRFMPYMVEVERPRTFPDGFIQWVLSAPPVISPRDYVARVFNHHEPATGSYLQVFESIDDPAYPPREDAVRVARLRGSWQLEPRPGGATLATYTYYCDPGGWVPAFAVNLGTRQTVAPILLAVETRALQRMAAAGGGGAPGRDPTGPSEVP